MGYSTKQRNILLDYLKNNKNRELSISQIYDGVKDFDIGESTVYRQMSRLISDGEVKRVSGNDGKNVVYRYIDKSSGCDAHFHLKCEKCGTIIHLKCDKILPIAEHIEDDHGFSVNMAKSEILGICKTCKENAV